MKKIAFALLLCLFVFEIPTLGACPIDSIKNCEPSEKQLPQPQQQNQKPGIQKKIPLTKTLNSIEDISYAPDCQFGVCQPKPPKR